jgi:hypothetical protein
MRFEVKRGSRAGATIRRCVSRKSGRGGGSINTGRFLTDVRGNQGDLLTTLLGCAGVPLDRPIGIATKQLKAITT